MKTSSSQVKENRRIAGWLLAVRRLMNDAAASLPAIGLAEGGDVRGAAELFERSRRS
jgi:hypothetical protein